MLFETLDNAFAFLPEELRGLAVQGAQSGLVLATCTVILTLILELASLPTVRGVLKQRDGRSLYMKSIAINFVNHYIFGVPVYMAASLLFLRQDEPHIIFDFAVRTTGVLIVHGFCYYSVHKAFHSSPSLYKHHRFHHRYNTHVPPVSANAVSAVEYLTAYVIPFAVGALVMHPTNDEMSAAVGIVSVANLLIHTPRLEQLSERLVWGPFVSTHDHIEHHKRLTTNYAAPVVKWDWIFEKMDDLMKQKGY